MSHDEVVLELEGAESPSDSVLDDIQKRLDGAEPPVSAGCCIYKVPFGLRSLNEDAYKPKVVSIGPFHHGLPRLQNMERHKLFYCKAFLQRVSPGTLDTLFHYIENVESHFRRCYSDTIELSKEELVKVILVDSCFILELFCRHKDNDQSDTFLSKTWISTDIGLDLCLLENQLPFFVLDVLYKLSFPSESESNSGQSPLLVLAFSYFSFLKIPDLVGTTTIRHFTDLVRALYLHHPPEKRPPMGDIPDQHLPSATELVEAGVRFKANTGSNCLLDLSFSRGVLEIPLLNLEDPTEILFRNMVALELCHYPDEPYITDYILVWDFLINSSKDVDVLVQEGVLVNWLGDTDSAANLFNGLCKNITTTSFNSNYSLLWNDLNDYHKDCMQKLKATLKRDYCHTPWQTAASIAGIVLLVLSLLQSVCSVLQVIQGNKK